MAQVIVVTARRAAKSVTAARIAYACRMVEVMTMKLLPPPRREKC